MTEGSTLGRGRPSTFHPLLHALAPDWPYTPAMIASLAERHGFLDLLKEGGLLRERVRGTLARYPRVRNWPRGEDPIVHIGERDYQGWPGWRWQGHPDLATGLARRAVWVGSLVSVWPSGQTLSLSELANLLQRCGQAHFQNRAAPESHAAAISARICALWVVQWVLAQGLDPRGQVRLDEWREPLELKWSPHSRKALLEIVRRKPAWSIHDLIAHAQNERLLTEQEARLWRRGLYDLIRRRGYPQTGDGQFLLREQWLPSWHKLTWQRVLGFGAAEDQGTVDEVQWQNQDGSAEVR